MRVEATLRISLWGGTTSAGLGIGPATFAGAPGGFIPEGAISSAGVSAAPATTIGGLLGGAGLGFGAGSLLAGFTPHPMNGTIGAGVGSLAGAALGSLLLPGPGTIIGGLFGGAIGGCHGLIGRDL